MRFNDDSTYCDTAGATAGCDSDCAVIDGWYCEGGSYTDPDSCYELCGDDYNWGALECDDVGTSLDGCSSSCEVEDGWYCRLDGYETPDVLDTASTAAHDCFEICGDGKDFSEFGCDDGNSYDNDGCDSDCVIELGWGCAGGNSMTADSCYEICGDDYDMRMLGCDDGNSA